jgi:hypothetical protein
LALGPRLGQRRVHGRPVPLDAIDEAAQFAWPLSSGRDPIRQIILSSLADDHAEPLGQVVHRAGLLVGGEESRQRVLILTIEGVHLADEPPAHLPRRGTASS